MNEKKKEFDFGEFIEKYRLYIGGGLLLLILIGSGLLLYRENYLKPSLELRIKNLEIKINQLESEQKISNSKSISTRQSEGEMGISNQNPNEQSSNVQTEQVAGADSQNTDNSKQMTAKQSVTGKININTASATELDTLAGVGPVTAKNIIDYRTQHGSFKTIDELDKVKGIGKKTIDKFRDKVSL